MSCIQQVRAKLQKLNVKLQAEWGKAQKLAAKKIKKFWCVANLKVVT